LPLRMAPPRMPRVSSAQLLKNAVRSFWNEAPCGVVYAQGDTVAERLRAQASARYQLEPYIPPFARFADGAGMDVLEIGVGAGVDHAEWARSRPRSLTGIDLTDRAIELTRERLEVEGLRSTLFVGDAENLAFRDASFDLVYSWGVLHHTPDTERTIREIARVVRPGGRARIMLYRRPSLVALMLWARYALAAGRPWRSLSQVVAEHLESPGTRALTVSEARRMFAPFSATHMKIEMSFADLLEGAVGQRHGGPVLATARALFPRRAVKAYLGALGSQLLIEAVR
jgi:SAM-dependent methyltransferase